MISESRSPPTYDDLASAVAGGLVSLARTAHRPVTRLGLDTPLDPLRSSSELKYVHEGDLLRLKLVLDNVTLIGFKTLTVQEVTFKRPDEGFYDNPWTPDAGDKSNYRGEEEPQEMHREAGRRRHEEEEDEEGEEDDYNYSEVWQPEGDLYQYEDWSKMAMRDAVPASLPSENGGNYESGGKYLEETDARSRRQARGAELPTSSEGTIRVAFKQMAVKAKYQVRGSAGGFFTFRETGDLTLSSPTVFLTTKLNVTLPGFGYHPLQTAVPRHGRVKVLWARSSVSIGSTSLILQPGAYPPEWIRQQVQSKLEELSSDLSHGHGAVRLLLRRWGRLIKKLIHRTARSLTK